MRLPSTLRTWPGSKGSIMRWSFAMRRIQRPDLIDIVSARAAPAAVATRQPTSGVRRGRTTPEPAGLRSRILDDDVGKLGAEVFGLLRDGHRGLARDLLVNGGDRPVGLRDDGRPSGIGLLADVDVQGQRAEERHV